MALVPEPPKAPQLCTQPHGPASPHGSPRPSQRLLRRRPFCRGRGGAGQPAEAAVAAAMALRGGRRAAMPG